MVIKYVHQPIVSIVLRRNFVLFIRSAREASSPIAVFTCARQSRNFIRCDLGVFGQIHGYDFLVRIPFVDNVHHLAHAA